MQVVRNFVFVVLLMFGCVWILQGMNVLPGSFMSGQMRWAVWGAILAVAGIAGLVWTNRKRQSAPERNR
jgi:low temperature requirement protein LtrA